MDPELFYSKFYQALTEKRYRDAKNTIYEAHRSGMPAGHILVKIVNRTLDQLQKSTSGEISRVAPMDLSHESEEYYQYLIAANRNAADKLVDKLCRRRVSPMDIMIEVISPAMDKLGELQSCQQISLAQIFMAARIVDDAMGKLQPLMPERPAHLGKIILGNAFGDHHGLGRKMLASFLRFYGFDVVDLGLSVANEKFVEHAIKEKARLIFVSALLLHTAENIHELRNLLIERKLNNIKIVGGGAPFNFDREFYKSMGCDATAVNAMEAVKVAKRLLGIS